MREETPVTFYLPDEVDIKQVEVIDPDRNWRYFGTGIACWIVQTYLRLKKAGRPVQLSACIPHEGIVIVHADHMHTLLSSIGNIYKCMIACVRADRSANLYADIEIVQNTATADNRRTFFVPHWPQPGLIGRDPERGTLIQNVAYKGEYTQLNEVFQTAEWVDFLNNLCITWVIDAVAWNGKARVYQNVKWNDYSEVDVLLAVRRNMNNHYLNKPASKLTNAWAAGVPAVLGPESAYRQLRKSRLDYIEVSSVVEAKVALERLRIDAGLYREMVSNGLERAKEFSVTNIQQRWTEVLFHKLPAMINSNASRLTSALPVGLKFRLRKLLLNGKY